jgi:long-chain acyl-CoA synthetase
LIQAPTPSAPRGHETTRARPRRRTRDPLLEAFERLVKRRPLAPLVMAESRRATAADVDSLALAAHRALETRESPETPAAPRTPAAPKIGGRLAPGAVVAVAAANGPGLLAALIAARRAGLAALLLDGQAPPAEALRIAQALRASVLLRCATPWPAALGDWEATRLPGAGLECALHLPDAAVVKLTSGSTGEPRGIATSAAALLADDAALVRTMGLRDDDRLVAAIPMSHSYGLSSLALPALLRGTPLVMPEDGGLGGPLAAAERLGATVLPTVPAYLDALLRLSDAPRRPPALRLVITAGAPLSPRTAAAFREAYGLPVHVFYGASECGGICYDREGGAAERGTVGAPVEGVEVELLPAALGAPAPDDPEGPEGTEGRESVGDDEAWRPAGASGGGGTLVVRSPAVAAGYVPDADPRLAGGRFVAGDIGAWRHGELVLLGRQDDMVNIKGKKVNPREVESVLGELHGVEEVVVLGVPVSDRGGEVLRAVIACRPGGLTRDDVLAWCRDRLAAHKVPRSLILVPEIPRGGRGKPDRAALLALRAAPAPATPSTPSGRPIPSVPGIADAEPKDGGRAPSGEE